MADTEAPSIHIELIGFLLYVARENAMIVFSHIKEEI